MEKRKAISSLLVLALVVSACGGGEPGRLEALAEPVDVTVSPVVTAFEARHVPARVAAAQRAELATRVSGAVQAVLVDVGAAVRRGQVLIRLDGSDVASAEAAAGARVTVARRYYDRISALERDGAATAQELDRAQADLEVAQAALAEAVAAREYVLLRAPFDGTVTARMVDPGDLSVPGQPVLTITGVSGVKVEADVPAPLVTDVASGDSVTVLLPVSGDRLAAVVSRTVPVIEPATQRFRVEARFAEGVGPLPLPGTYVRLVLGRGARRNSWVPADAIVERGQLTGVYLLDADRLRLRWVRPGRRGAEAVEILAGVSEGELVVRRPPQALSDGMRVGEVERGAWDGPRGADATP